MYWTMLLIVGIGAVLGAALGATRRCEDGGCPLTATPKRGAVYGALLGLLVAGLWGARGADGPSDPAERLADETHVSVLAPSIVAESGTSVMYFHADWCAACREFSPILSNVLTGLGREIAFSSIDVDKMPDTASRYRVQYLPTTIVFEDGQEQRRFVGVVGERALADALT